MSPRTDITGCMKHVPLLRLLPKENLTSLRKAAQHRRLEPGEHLIHRGEPIHFLVVVARGRLKVSRTNASGREQVLRELTPGGFFGELSLFTEVVSDGDVIATSQVDACLLQRQAFRDELQRNPQAAWPLSQFLAERLAQAEQAIGELALFDVPQRLAAALWRLVDEGGSGHAAELPHSWAELASRLGTTPESLSRSLKRLEADGLVETEGRRVRVLDPDRLRAFLDSV